MGTESTVQGHGALGNGEGSDHIRGLSQGSFHVRMPPLVTVSKP